jgi:hypothetical protein
LADEAALTIEVCHFPPGTSKWNKVEHRLFSFISTNWRGEPLRDYETIVRLIAGTTTAKGLAVSCRLDRRKYPAGRKVTDEEMKMIRMTPRRSAWPRCDRLGRKSNMPWFLLLLATCGVVRSWVSALDLVWGASPRRKDRLPPLQRGKGQTTRHCVGRVGPAVP